MVAVVSPSSMVDELASALAEAGLPFGEASTQGLESPITLVAVEDVKGLEFDSVIVVEPALIVDQSAQGLRSLYVALTRPTRRLTVLHSQPLPDALGAARV
jgi:superfamily I DNA/RNA helicase